MQHMLVNFFKNHSHMMGAATLQQRGGSHGLRQWGWSHPPSILARGTTLCCKREEWSQPFTSRFFFFPFLFCVLLFTSMRGMIT